MKTIREAATDLCDRWDTLLWKDVEHTAVFIHELRMALAQPEQEPLTEWLVCPKCSYKSPYSPIKARTLAEDAERITKQTRAALAQPEQEPVATVAEVHKSRYTIEWTNGPVPEGTKLYTTPPKREWVGLTLVEVNEIEKNGDFWEDHTPFDFFQAIEAKLKELNE
jgi:hypothetical protein